uniref:Protein containing FLYWCH domain n=1 Tax=Rhipicephalus zambeziensis TaxID=60191 RepID=A0A224Y6M4_9ACAR
MDARKVRGGSGDTDPGLQQANALLPVQLVPTPRGGFKAKYGGFTFNMETSKGSRRHWHCNVRGCKSRLTTDEYGEDHVVFKLTAHNEDVHQRAANEKKRRRSEAAFRQQVTTKIGDFSYILEDTIGEHYCWRCKYVQCKGKCRTDRNGRLVLGPSEHSCVQLSGSAHVSAGSQGDQIDNEESTQSAPGSFTCQKQEEERDEPAEKKPKLCEQVKQEKLEGSKIIDSEVVKSEPGSQPGPFVKRERSLNASPEPDASGDITSTDACDRDNKRRPSHSGHVLFGERSEERGASVCKKETASGAPLSSETARRECVHILSESEDEDGTEDDRSAVNTSGREVQDDAEQPFSSADAKDKAAWSHKPVSTDYEGSSDDYDEEADEEPGVADSSVCDEANMSRSPHARCAQVLQVTNESSEREMRIALFRQMCELLRAETELAKQRCRNAALRECLLVHRLADLEPESKSTSTDI